jgi:hypothetical protein
MSISILSDVDDLMNNGDNMVIRMSAIQDNPYRENLSIEEYIQYLGVYTKVALSYAEFFQDYWYKDDVAKTNQKMIEELERVGIKGWSGMTEEENNPLGEYVLSLDCPVTATAMREFFKRVMMGDLEFRCRYPIGETSARDLVRHYVPFEFFGN